MTLHVNIGNYYGAIFRVLSEFYLFTFD